MLLRPLESMTRVPHTDVRQKQMDCITQVCAVTIIPHLRVTTIVFRFKTYFVRTSTLYLRSVREMVKGRQVHKYGGTGGLMVNTCVPNL